MITQKALSLSSLKLNIIKRQSLQLKPITTVMRVASVVILEQQNFLVYVQTEYAQFLISWVPWYTTVIRLSVKTRWLVAKMGKSPGKFSDESPV